MSAPNRELATCEAVYDSFVCDECHGPLIEDRRQGAFICTDCGLVNTQVYEEKEVPNDETFIGRSSLMNETMDPLATIATCVSNEGTNQVISRLTMESFHSWAPCMHASCTARSDCKWAASYHVGKDMIGFYCHKLDFPERIQRQAEYFWMTYRSRLDKRISLMETPCLACICLAMEQDGQCVRVIRKIVKVADNPECRKTTYPGKLVRKMQHIQNMLHIPGSSVYQRTLQLLSTKCFQLQIPYFIDELASLLTKVLRQQTDEQKNDPRILVAAAIFALSHDKGSHRTMSKHPNCFIQRQTQRLIALRLNDLKDMASPASIRKLANFIDNTFFTPVKIESIPELSVPMRIDARKKFRAAATPLVYKRPKKRRKKSANTKA